MKNISAKDANTLCQGEKWVCLDIRETYEYEAENIGWKNIPMAEVMNYLHQHKIALDVPILLLCNTGRRAAALGNLLHVEAGYTEVYVVEHGMEGWMRETNLNSLT